MIVGMSSESSPEGARAIGASRGAKDLPWRSWHLAVAIPSGDFYNVRPSNDSVQLVQLTTSSLYGLVITIDGIINQLIARGHHIVI